VELRSKLSAHRWIIMTDLDQRYHAEPLIVCVDASLFGFLSIRVISITFDRYFERLGRDCARPRLVIADSSETFPTITRLHKSGLRRNDTSLMLSHASSQIYFYAHLLCLRLDNTWRSS
jgi:hypothetical protein